MKEESATFAAGCFWGVEVAFRQVPGVIETTVGYSGGDMVNPTYRDVCSEMSGHAEAVHIQYDANKVSYKELLRIFWRIHDPTTLNRQGPDRGPQYRSVIFYHTPTQEAAARASKEDIERSGLYQDPVVTEIVPAQAFYRAEEYHQRYLEKQGRATCHL